jgi:hypothetical protein
MSAPSRTRDIAHVINFPIIGTDRTSIFQRLEKLETTNRRLALAVVWLAALLVAALSMMGAMAIAASGGAS